MFEGGYEELCKSILERQREDREKEFKEQHGETKVPKWDPTNPRNKETFEPERATYDDGDDDIMETIKPFTGYSNDEPAPAPARAPEPEPAEEEEEEEYEEEEEEE